MLRLVRPTLVAIWLIVIAGAGFVITRLYCASPLARHDNEAPPALVAQLAANRAALDAA